MFRAIYRFFIENIHVRRVLTPSHYWFWVKCFIWRLPEVIRLRSLGPVDERFGDEFCIKHGDRQLHFKQASFGVVREIFGRECYCTAEELKTARNILDLGANVGAFGLFALSSAPHAKVHMVEAQPEFIPVLNRNIFHNGFAARATCENALVGGVHDNWTRHLCERFPKLQNFSISRYLAEVGQCDFLKCDIEGAEYVLFSGDISWTIKVRRIALEYHGTWEQGHALGELLRAKGFTVTQLPHGTLGYLAAIRS